MSDFREFPMGQSIWIGPCDVLAIKQSELARIEDARRAAMDRRLDELEQKLIALLRSE